MKDSYDNLEKMINDAMHEPQPHTILGKLGQQVITLKEIQIYECFLRGMLDGGTHYHLDENGELLHNVDTEKLEYHRCHCSMFRLPFGKGIRNLS